MRKKLLSLTNDYVFKRNFGYKGEEEITRVLLKDIMQSNISLVELDNNPITQKDLYDEKLGIMDVKAVIDNESVCDIEMQVVKQKDIIKRILFYWSKLYAGEIKKGNAYDTAKKAICILIADFEIKELEDIEKYVTKWNLREQDYPKKILTNSMEFYIIELPKVAKFRKVDQYKNLNLWVDFIKNPEVCNNMDSNDENLKETIEAIKNAKKKLEEISDDEHERELARLREKYILDQKSILATGYADGFQEGMEEGRTQGINEGRAEGIVEGEKIGKKERNIEIAKNLLKENVDISIIEKCTGLDRKEIEKLL